MRCVGDQQEHDISRNTFPSFIMRAFPCLHTQASELDRERERMPSMDALEAMGLVNGYLHMPALCDAETPNLSSRSDGPSPATVLGGYGCGRLCERAVHRQLCRSWSCCVSRKRRQNPSSLFT